MTEAVAVASSPWSRAVEEHRDSLAALVDAIQGLDEAVWRLPRAPGKWSPAQIAEHLVLAYEHVLRELAGEGTMRPRVSPRRQRLLRWFLLPHILFHQSIPVRSRSPREIRPSPAGIDRLDALLRLPELAERCEEALFATLDTGVALRHPYFGAISPVQTLRLSAAHLQHHRRQMLETGR